MVGLELSRHAVVDESIVREPLDGPALGTNITHRVPRRNQCRVVLIDLILEVSECSRPCRDCVGCRPAVLSLICHFFAGAHITA